MEKRCTNRPASYPIPAGGRRAGSLLAAVARRLRRSAAVLALGAGLTVASCQTTPVTGRSSFNLFTAEQDVELGREAFSQVLASERTVRSGPRWQMVKNCFDRITAVADDPGWEWEVVLLDNDATVNAFALPGGKMAVYTGIIPVAQTEEGLAVVMGHEIGHVVAQHGTERMTQSMGLEVVTALLSGNEYAQLAQGALQYGVALPFGRSQESEADEIGLIYMARAGYDPRESVAFWQRMAQLSGGGPPEFLSTHPSHETRATRLEELMPRALREYEQATGRPTGTN